MSGRSKSGSRKAPSDDEDFDEYLAFLDSVAAPKPAAKPKKPRKAVDERIAELPEELPVLCGDDVSAGRSDKSADRRHLSAWVEACLPESHYADKVRGVLASALMEEVRAATGYHGLSPPSVSVADLAAIWNSTLRNLGYPVPLGSCVILCARKKKEE